MRTIFKWCMVVKNKTLAKTKINARKVELVIAVSITVERSKRMNKREICLDYVHDYILGIVVSMFLN